MVAVSAAVASAATSNTGAKSSHIHRAHHAARPDCADTDWHVRSSGAEHAAAPGSRSSEGEALPWTRIAVPLFWWSRASAARYWAARVPTCWPRVRHKVPTASTARWHFPKSRCGSELPARSNSGWRGYSRLLFPSALGRRRNRPHRPRDPPPCGVQADPGHGQRADPSTRLDRRA